MTLMVAILLLLIVSRLAAEIAERLGQPGMIGEIIAGIVLGPSIFNLIHPTPELAAIADLGVFLLMLLAGMEIDTPRLLLAFRGRNIWISICGFVLPFLLGMAAGWLLDLDAMRIVFIGLCIAITALPVSVRILMDLDLMHTSIARQIIAAAIANDVLALLVLGVLLDLGGGSGDWSSALSSAGWTIVKLLLFMGLVIAVSRFATRAVGQVADVDGLVQRALGSLRMKEPLFGVTLLFVLGFAGLADALGLHFVVGAFFGSMLLSHELLGQRNFEQVQNTASGVTMSLLAPLFFASVGLEFNVWTMTEAWLITVVLTAAFAGKMLAGLLGGRLAGLSRAESWALGIGLNGRGIMELVVAKIALANGFIANRLFTVLVLVGVVTTLVTPILLKHAFRKLDELKP